MSASVEAKTRFGRCACCLQYGCVRHLWTPVVADGGAIEVYGQMLADCFMISWERTPENTNREWICESCVCRLRKCHRFREQLSEAATAALQDLKLEPDVLARLKVEIKEEREEGETEVHYEEVEYLEDDLTEHAYGAQSEPPSQLSQIDDTKPKRRKAKKRTSDGRGTTRTRRDSDTTLAHSTPPGEHAYAAKVRGERGPYRQYSPLALQRALDEVARGRLSPGAAALHYRVPRKTLHYKMAHPEDPVSVASQLQWRALVADIRAVLAHCNATPFRSRVEALLCFYCGAEPGGPSQLRAHTAALHCQERLSAVDRCMRPPYFNEVLKLDVAGLRCACGAPMASWPTLLDHLRGRHGLELTQGARGIVPYALEAGAVRCGVYLCACASVCAASAHLDAHFANHVCPRCAAPAASLPRLAAHVRSHSEGRLPCPECGKGFSQGRYLRAHLAHSHRRVARLKCRHCELRFSRERLRAAHALEAHPALESRLVCHLCGAAFAMRNSFASHIKRHRLRDACVPVNK